MLDSLYEMPEVWGKVLSNFASLLFQRHRVLLPPVGDSSARHSLAFFVQPDNEALITCCDGSDKYPPITGGEYLMQRFSESYGKSWSESQSAQMLHNWLTFPLRHMCPFSFHTGFPVYLDWIGSIFSALTVEISFLLPGKIKREWMYLKKTMQNKHVARSFALLATFKPCTTWRHSQNTSAWKKIKLLIAFFSFAKDFYARNIQSGLNKTICYI